MYISLLIGEIVEVDDIPKLEYKKPPVAPKEGYGEGCNAKVYYVCNDGMFVKMKIKIRSLHFVFMIMFFCVTNLK